MYKKDDGVYCFGECYYGRLKCLKDDFGMYDLRFGSPSTMGFRLF